MKTRSLSPAAFFLLTVFCGFAAGEEAGERKGATDRFESDNYTATWGAVGTFDVNAVLEIGEGNGHGETLAWIRFQPGKGGVDVLSFRLDQDRLPYESKWPPDRAAVAVKHARMKTSAYTELLSDLAVVNAAKLKPVVRNGASLSSHDFWVYARLQADQKTLLDLNWAGYEGSRAEIEYARPQAAVHLALEAVEGLDFENHSLSDNERARASAKFVRDWKKFKDLEFHWWVRERYIIMIGIVGDATAFPTLRTILDRYPEDRCVYHAINAVTRLTQKDVRDRPVEEMDVQKVRRKILEVMSDDN